ncbi:vesicle-fusion atpase [Tupanvirus deep ocean]|uniref:Vesicle-fusion atpase n=2 Tax=Tupanvirus TaxID=2094720 RepID=A0AC62A940_9VIRU|nr:vesicle-fusion atpase [Tupanvirus deep ocean]QKU34254.1 vesicle-fusion atpase [Tupanvirus deep ocean]
MSKLIVKVNKSINNDYARKNVVYYKSLPGAESECFIQFNSKKYVKLANKLNEEGMENSYVYLNNQDRIYLGTALNDPIEISIIPKPEIASSILVSIRDKTKTKELDFVTESHENTITSIFKYTVVNTNTSHAIYAPDLLYVNIVTILDKNKNEITNGFINEETEIIIINTDKKTLKFNLSSINFEKVGVGGLEKEFTELVKSIFVTRIIPEKVYKKLNIKHTKGAILYGPPGCGKTRIARQIGSLIGCVNIRIINGPELLNKYVGESEKNVRECFEAAKNKPDELHLLIFDEFDAIATRRSGSENNNNDKVVGQLLTMLDGVEEINNIIVFALTNRLDIIDPAILRPGRFGVHIKIDLPDAKGRHEILQIHSSELVRNNLFKPDVDLMLIAKETENFTGAELESLVQNTVQNVLGSQIDFNNIVESAKKIENITIGMNDFFDCLSKMNPMFKNKNKIKAELKNKIKKPLTDTDHILVLSLIEYIKSKSYPVVTCIDGTHKSGKTSIVCEIAMKIPIDNVEYISASSMSHMTDKFKIEYLTEIFSKSTPSLIILDNIEMIIEFVSEMVFNKNVLHIIRILLNETKHNVIITTSYYDKLSLMTVLDSVEKYFRIMD